MNEDTYKEALKTLFSAAQEIVQKAYFQAPQDEPDKLPEKCLIEKDDIKNLDAVLSKIRYEQQLA